MPSPAASPPAPKHAARWPWLLLLLLLGLLVLLLVFDWNWLRGPLERRLEAASGREVSIGRLDVELGWPPTVVLDDVRLGNADWSHRPWMAQADRLAFQLSPWPALRGRWVLPSLRVEQATLLLERGSDDRANWRFNEERGSGDAVALGALHVEDGILRYLERDRRTNLTLAVDSVGRQAPRAAERSGAPLRLDGKGRYRGSAFRLEGTVESPLALGSSDQHYSVDLQARAGATRAHASGTLQPPLDLTDFSVRFSLAGDDLAKLHRLFGIALPSTPPYSLEGMLTRSGEVWRYRDFRGRIGDSDLSGRVTLDVAGERPFLKGKLTADLLDFDDLGASIGAVPGTGPEETASAEQRRRAAERAAADRLLPDRELTADRLRAMDADLTLDAAEVDAGKLPIAAVSMRALLEAGVLRLEPLSLVAAGGRIEGSALLDARGDPLIGRADLRARGLELPQLYVSEVLEGSAGKIAGSIALSGRGNSLANMLGSANGQVAAAMGSGRISNLLLEKAGLDIAEVLGFMLTEDRTVPIRCAFAEFRVEDGVMHAEALALDTTDTVIFGEGIIDLDRERFDLVLHPQPKDRSIAALRVPLEVSGSLRDPEISPKGGRLALRALAGAALYAVAPPAALLAMVETGPGESTDCLPDSRSAAEHGERIDDTAQSGAD